MFCNKIGGPHNCFHRWERKNSAFLHFSQLNFLCTNKSIGPTPSAAHHLGIFPSTFLRPTRCRKPRECPVKSIFPLVLPCTAFSQTEPKKKVGVQVLTFPRATCGAQRQVISNAFFTWIPMVRVLFALLASFMACCAVQRGEWRVLLSPCRAPIERAELPNFLTRRYFEYAGSILFIRYVGRAQLHRGHNENLLGAKGPSMLLLACP